MSAERSECWLASLSYVHGVVQTLQTKTAEYDVYVKGLGDWSDLICDKLNTGFEASLLD